MPLRTPVRSDSFAMGTAFTCERATLAGAAAGGVESTAGTHGDGGGADGGELSHAAEIDDSDGSESLGFAGGGSVEPGPSSFSKSRSSEGVTRR